MTTYNPINPSPFLRTSRDFPKDADLLTDEISKAYIDTAKVVNDRTIGIFVKHRPTVTGESWFIDSQRKRQTIRQLFTFTASGAFDHHIENLGELTRIYGTFTNGTNWYPLPFVDVLSATNQVSLYVTPTQIVITAGAGAPPAITKGYVILEWLTFGTSVL